MANFEGMDTAEVRRRAGDAKRVAGDWRGRIQGLDGKVKGLKWVGRDHDQYITHWDSAVKNIRGACDALDSLVSTLNSNANDQDSIS